MNKLNTSRWPPFAFAGLDYPDLEEAKVIIVPVPFDSTSSYRAGSRNGPERIIEASRYMELYDRETDWSPCDVGIFTTTGIEPVRGSVELTLERVKSEVLHLLRRDKLPVLLGGDHSITIGGVAAASSVFPNLGVVVLDAHCDLRQSYEGSGFSHACTVRRILDITEKVVVLGARSCSSEELDEVRRGAVSVHFWDECDPEGSQLRMEEAVRSTTWIKSSPLYLSIDLDVLDPSQMPGVGAPEPGGMSYGGILKVLRLLCSEGNVVSLDVTELTPIPGDVRSEFAAAKIVYKFIGYRFKGGRPSLNGGGS